jgi:phage/plasmid-like protein (TIGR03299 family)
MAHEITTIDRVGLLGKQAWHNLGIVIDEELSAIAAAERFGLTWPVAQYPLVAKLPDGTELEIPTHVANVRTADQDGNAIRHLLGVVGADYSVCQNRELAEFTDALAQTGRVTIESCGSVRGGKRVWFLARGEAFDVGGSDKVWPYVLVSNGHDGTQAIRITPTTVRVVCSNTLHMVIPDVEGTQAESAAYVIRHSGLIADKLGQARQALAQYETVRARNVELFDKLAGRRMDREQAAKPGPTRTLGNLG